MSSAQVRHVISWILVVLLAAAYGIAALGKLSGAATQMFADWGYQAWFATLIGVLELAGALGLLIPKTTRYAILGLTGIMLGAAYTHLANGEGMQVLRPAIFLVVLWVVWWLRRLPGTGGRSAQ